MVECDHLPTERGQSYSEMMEDFYSDAFTTDVSASSTLEEEFGHVEIIILENPDSQFDRESIRISTDKRVLAYNLVSFCKASRDYKKEHNDILRGKPIAEIFERSGHKVLRLERCSFFFDLPEELKKLFRTKKQRSTAKVVNLYVDSKREDNQYAEIIEIYSPIVEIQSFSSIEIEKGLIRKTKEVLARNKWMTKFHTP